MTKILVIGNDGEYDGWYMHEIALVRDDFNLEDILKEFFYVYSPGYRLFEFKVLNNPYPDMLMLNEPFKIVLSTNNMQYFDRELNHYTNEYFGGCSKKEILDFSHDDIDFYTLSDFVYNQEYDNFISFCKRRGDIIEIFSKIMTWK